MAYVPDLSDVFVQGGTPPQVAKDLESRLVSVDPVTGAVSDPRIQALVSGAGIPGPQTSIMWLGDSLTEHGVLNKHPLAPGLPLKTYGGTYNSISVAGGWIRSVMAAATCPAGNGTLRWYAADQTLSWQANGDTEGVRVPVASKGFVVVPSGTQGSALYLRCNPRNVRPASNQTEVLNIPANTSASAGISRSLNSGFSGAWEIYAGHPFDVSYNFGIAGAATVDLLTYIDQWNSVKTDVTVIHIGTNDADTIAGKTAAFENLKEIVSARKATGSTVIVGLLFGGSSTFYDQTEYRAVVHYNNLVRDWCIQNKIPYFDGMPFLLDPYSTVGNAAPNMFRDGLHLAGPGALKVAKYALDPVLSPYCVKKQPRVTNALYDAVLAPGGNLLANGQLTGTVTSANAGVTGTVPTGCNLGRNGATVTMHCTAPQDASPILRTDGKPGAWCRIVAASPGLADSFVFQLAAINTANYAVGDTVVLTGEWRYSGSAIQSLSVAAFSNVGSSVVGGDNTTSVQLLDLSGETVQAYFETEPFTLLPGTTSLRPNFAVSFLADGAITLDVAPTVTMRKVPAPAY